MADEKYPINEVGAMGKNWWNSIFKEGVEDSFSLSSIRSSLGKSQVDWSYINELKHTEAIIECEVIAINQGGLLVSNDSVTGFVPISHLKDFAHLVTKNKKESILKKFLGENLKLKIIESEKSRGRIVLSERAAQSKPGARNKIISSLRKGQKVKGQVTNITEFGVFVDLGGIEGLIHISELSWARVASPNLIVRLNQEIEAMVIGVQKREGKISLSLKRLEDNPWDTIEITHPPGTTVHGRITKIVNYGAFVEIEGGFEGLIHASEMALKEGMVPKDVVQKGKVVEIEIVRIDATRKRMSFRLIG